MYIEDINKLKFYNKPGNPVFPPYYKPDSIFNVFTFLFGKKDFLIYYIDGVSNYINNNRNFTPTSFYQLLVNSQNAKKQEYTFTLEGRVDQVGKNNITIAENGITVFCYMYRGRKFSIKQGDLIKLACSYKGGLDRNKKILKLINCIQL